MAHQDKKPKAAISPHPTKTPSVSADPQNYYGKNPSWQVGMIEMKDHCGWHKINGQILHEIRDRLKNFESMTWKEILGKDHHLINRNKLKKEAQKHLLELKLDDFDHVLSLRLTGQKRIWGIMTNGVVKLLWWDPEHEICPSQLKHT